MLTINNSIKFLRTIIFLHLFLAVNSCLLYADGKFKEILGLVKPNVVYVYNLDENDEARALGTGFFIDRDGSILTNLHVVEGASKIIIKTHNGMTYQLNQVLNTDEDSDLFLFNVFGINHVQDHLELDVRKFETGDDVLVVGNPLGLEQTVSTGIVSGIRDIEEFGYVYQITAPISSGSSGSPVVNSDGKVIGIATFQATIGQNLNFVIPAEKIEPLIYRAANISFSDWKKRGFTVLPTTAYGMTNLSERLYMRDDYKRATNCALLAIQRFGKYARAYKLAGLGYSKLGDFKKALGYTKYAIQIDPKLYGGHNCIGLVYHEMKDYKSAEKQYFTEIHYNKDNYSAYYNLGQLYMDQKDPEKAIEILKRGTDNCEDSGVLHNSLAGIYDKQKQYSKAALHYKKAIKMDVYDADTVYRLGIVFVKLNRLDDAEEIYDLLKEPYPKLAAELKKKIER